MAFPPQFLDEIRNRVSLASVVSRHVKLVRRGREFVGLCPFHNEKTPSFAVVEDKAFYHCFGCGAHGDVIGFSMRVSNAGFREAVEMLAKEAGLEIPDELPEDRERAVRAKTLHEVCEAAALHFERALKEPGAEKARAYLVRRGLDAAAAARFRLGWAPNLREGLKRALGQEFEESLLVEAGLLRRAEGGDTFDFFRNRVMFPIADRQGRVIAFGGRLIEDGEPKYLNSPDTPIFEKGRTLYAVHLAKAAPRGDLVPIVAEGYMDVIALHQAGFSGAVAPLGTALTETQLLELWRLGDRPILCFDGDKAGRGAAVRALDRALQFLRPANGIRFVELPPNEDPDSLLKSQGEAVLRKYLEGAVDASAFIWRMATDGHGPDFFTTPEKVLRLHARIEKYLRKILDGQVQKEFQNYLSSREKQIRRRIWRLLVLEERMVSATIRATDVAGWSEATQKKTGEILLIVVALNHPSLSRADIDSFGSLKVRDGELNELWQHVVERISTNQELTAEDLRSGLDGRMSRIMHRLWSSTLDRKHYAHLANNEEFARSVWRSMRARYELPEIEREHEEAVRQWADAGTDESHAAMLGYKSEIARLRTERDMVEAIWDRSVTTELTAR